MEDAFYNCLDFCKMYDRLPYFYITGGDPILHPDFWKLLELLKERDIPFTIPDAFCIAENMVLMAAALGISSCIIARGEETFDNEMGAALLREWEIPENYIARCFVLLGFCDGKYPNTKPRKESKSRIVE